MDLLHNYLIISINKEKINKLQHIFTVKVLQNVILDDSYNIIKTIYMKPRVNIILNGEIMKQFYWRQEGNRDVYYL